MTRKDYELIAKVLFDTMPLGSLGIGHSEQEMAQWLFTVRSFASELASTNPAFDPKRFTEACGVAQ